MSTTKHLALTGNGALGYVGWDDITAEPAIPSWAQWPTIVGITLVVFLGVAAIALLINVREYRLWAGKFDDVTAGSVIGWSVFSATIVAGACFTFLAMLGANVRDGALHAAVREHAVTAVADTVPTSWRILETDPTPDPDSEADIVVEVYDDRETVRRCEVTFGRAQTFRVIDGSTITQKAAAPTITGCLPDSEHAGQ